MYNGYFNQAEVVLRSPIHIDRSVSVWDVEGESEEVKEHLELRARGLL